MGIYLRTVIIYAFICLIRGQNDTLLRREVNDLRTTLEDMLQFNRNRNVQINDLPEREDEDVPTLIGKLSNLLRIPIMKSDIQAVHRIRGVPGRIRPLVIQFSNRQLRDAIMEASRRVRLTSCDFYPDIPRKPIYINEHLTRYYKKLLYETKRNAIDRGYKYCWFRNGKLFVRRDDQTPAIRVHSFADLDLL
ncbi:uncharacterized protein LOC142331127 isoform X4 [Lycorma delicatula]|uniref:uncharacterized protein LOC142331127 isoform X4 n=1 Tax=Lycorma delicatula TaxID=130591 RepID=UPI003F50F3DE